MVIDDFATVYISSDTLALPALKANPHDGDPGGTIHDQLQSFASIRQRRANHRRTLNDQLHSRHAISAACRLKMVRPRRSRKACYESASSRVPQRIRNVYVLLLSDTSSSYLLIRFLVSALQEATRGLTAEELATFLQKIGPALDERKFITQSEIEEERRVQEEEKPSPLDVVMQGFRLPSPSTMAVFMLAPLVFIDLYFRIWEGVKVLKL